MGKYPNSGILSRAQNRKSDKHPEYSGSAEIDGQEYWLSAWINEGEKGKFFKISFTPKQPQGQQGRSDGVSRSQKQDDDDTPF